MRRLIIIAYIRRIYNPYKQNHHLKRGRENCHFLMIDAKGGGATQLSGTPIKWYPN